MAINIKGKTLIFIEESSLQIKDFYNVLFKLSEDKAFKFIDITLDEKIKVSLELQKQQLVSMRYYYLEGFIDALEAIKSVNYVETQNYFDFTLLDNFIVKQKYDKVWYITQKESVFLNINDSVNHDNSKIYKVFNGELIEWIKTKETKRNAFFVEKNLFSNPIETDQIEFVYSPRYGYLKLFKDVIIGGGEGKIYKTFANQLCKIYHKEHLTYINHKKLQYMIEQDNYNPYINWPKDIIYYNGSFVGYLMDEVKNTTALDELRIDGFTGFTLIDRYEIAYNLLVNINYLHQKNIVIGDLKLDNILIKKPSDVYLIDSGSYQVNDYPCTVYHPEYTKIKYTEEELRKYLRSPEDEYYPINMIIFEILVGKKPNYDPDDAEIDSDRDVFKYPLDITKISSSSPNYLKLWAMMTKKMREMFYYYFTQNKVSYLPEWIQEIKLVIDANKQ